MSTLENSTWPIKHPLERITSEFDFGPGLASGDTLVSVELILTTVLGADATPGDLIFGAAHIKGTRVFQQLQAGLDGCSYRVECRATSANNNLLLLARVLPVKIF